MYSYLQTLLQTEAICATACSINPVHQRTPAHGIHGCRVRRDRTEATLLLENTHRHQPRCRLQAAQYAKGLRRRRQATTTMLLSNRHGPRLPLQASKQRAPLAAGVHICCCNVLTCFIKHAVNRHPTCSICTGRCSMEAAFTPVRNCKCEAHSYAYTPIPIAPMPAIPRTLQHTQQVTSSGLAGWELKRSWCPGTAAPA
jgi:hypothetical protein